jgi:glycosyltransferase involved in cell wall biosynthesis
MKFSFLICTKNSERTIVEVIESIASQHAEACSIEVVIVDYKSNDATLILAKKKLTEHGIKFKLINCDFPGKSPALTIGLDYSNADYSIIVDDDNILYPEYINNAILILEDRTIGCLGAIGVFDTNLEAPDWFPKYKGHYAIGTIPEAKDWVWGACAIVNMTAWKSLRNMGYEINLNPSRTDSSTPIAIGGEDTELSLAIHLMGYKVRFSEKLKFIHKFEQKRLTKEYLLQNTLGCCRSVPLTEIYRMAIYHESHKYPKIIWTLKLLKSIVGCIFRMTKGLFRNDLLMMHYNYNIARGIAAGYVLFFGKFKEVYNKLLHIKNENKQLQDRSS